MKFIHGIDRDQIYLFPVSVEETIDQDNIVRAIDLFVESLSLKGMGFKMDFVENGRPAYHPKDLLKLFIYGYLNKTRSSRDLEKECKRNIEVIWLLKGLQPDHNTISNYRRDNPKAIRNVFRATVQLAKNCDLIGGVLIAGDSTKLRAQNSKKNNYNEKKIERHVNYIEQKLEDYMEAMASADGDEKEEISNQIDVQIERLQKYEDIAAQLEASNDTQVSTSDPESRHMITRNNIAEVCYNVQATNDAKHCLIIDYEVTNENDNKAMGSMVSRATKILERTDITALFDKGYHNGIELETAQKLGVETLVAIPAVAVSSQAPNPAFNASEFIYHPDNDCYQCPAGNYLITNGKWHTKNRGKNARDKLVKRYITAECTLCEHKAKCTKMDRGRVIERSQQAEYIEQNRKNIEQKEALYKRRQAIVEHPFGTIKRQWGFSYIMTKKGKQRASSDVGLVFIAYNLRRIINILGFRGFLTALLTACSYLFAQISLLRLKIRHFDPLENIIQIFSPSEPPYLKPAYIRSLNGVIGGF